LRESAEVRGIGVKGWHGTLAKYRMGLDSPILHMANMANTSSSIQTYPSTYTEPRSVTKEKTTITKEFDSKGRVVKETKVTEIETETFQVTQPYYPTWTTTNAPDWSVGPVTSTDVKYGVTLQKAKD
jgi:hypothetical protein